ncbi:MAG TPA: CsbD family protein [Xanthobacteraceae bacterium]|nr:CsbD family protein [Xanthobacteraceae bacterium]
MTWDQIEVNWLIFKGKLKHNWAKLTDEDITRINGRRDELVARLQERYGFAKAESEREVVAWLRSQRLAA